MVFQVSRLARVLNCKEVVELVVVDGNMTLHKAYLGGWVSLEVVHHGEIQLRRLDFVLSMAKELVLEVVRNQTSYSTEVAALEEVSVNFLLVVRTCLLLLTRQLHTVLCSGRSLASRILNVSKDLLLSISLADVSKRTQNLEGSWVRIDLDAVRKLFFRGEGEGSSGCILVSCLRLSDLHPR